MNLLNFGCEHLENGTLNNMLGEVGIDDVGSFVKQFRNQTSHEAEASTHQSSTWSSFLNEVCQNMLVFIWIKYIYLFI